MNTNEIKSKLNLIRNFIGVYPRDMLPKDAHVYPQSLVCNTDTHDQEGTHWIAIYIDENGFGEYFDAYGLPPLNIEFNDYLDSHCTKFTYNHITLQCTTCVTCGEYCCAYLILRNAGFSFEEFISLFTTNQFTNDYIIKNIFNSIK